MPIDNPLQPETLYSVVCRPALPKDTPDVMALTSQIWEGDDYVPHVWSDWLADHQGLLAVVEYGSRVVGLSKLTRLAPDSWWLEGLRVHPDYEGMRIASRLHDYLLAHWQKGGNGVIRLATVSTREPVKHLAERTGFRQALEVSPFIADPIPKEDTPYTPLALGELGAAFNFTTHSETLELSAGLVELGWRWAAPALQHFKEAQERVDAWWWVQAGQRHGLLLTRRDEYAGKKLLMIQMVACTVERLSACLQDCRSLAADLELELVAWFAPLHPQAQGALEAAAFQRDWDDSLVIFEKRPA